MKPTIRDLLNILESEDPASPTDEPPVYMACSDNKARGMRFGSLMRHMDDNEIPFGIIEHEPERHDATRPLVIVVHPGDMIESATDWMDRKVGRQVQQYWETNEEGTWKELALWRKKNSDFVVLHRPSSEQFPDLHARRQRMGEGGSKLWAEILKGHRRGTVLFGDDLNTAASWIIRNLDVSTRPHIFLAGAYSTPEDGCLTFIGKAIERIVGPDRITVSEFSPPGSSPGPVWKPGK